jgi:type II secretion system protein N
MPPPTSRSNPRQSWLRWTLIALLLLASLAILLALLLTSSAFLRSVLLPRIGNAFHAEVTADDVALRPFSSLTLRGLRVRSPGAEPVFVADEIHLRYQLRNLLAGRLQLDTITLLNPQFHVVEQPDGSRNLDPFFPEQPPATDPSATPVVSLHNLTLRNATVRWTRLQSNGARTEITITEIDADLDQFANNANGHVTVAGQIEAEITHAAGLDRLLANLSAAAAFQLDPQLQPQSLALTSTNLITHAEGNWAELAHSRALLEIEWLPGKLEQATARFLRHDETLGRIRVAGPLNLARSEANLTLTLDEIGHPLLNLVGAPWQIEFGPTRLDAIVELALLRGGSSTALSGRINTTPFSLSRAGQPSPPIDLHLGFQTLIQPNAQAARVQTFTLQGRQDRRVMLQAELSRPVNLSWVDGLTTSDETTLAIQLHPLPITHWQPFVNQLLHEFELPPWTATHGTIQAQQLLTQTGNQTTLQGTLTLADFTGSWAGLSFQDYHAATRLEAALTGPRLELTEFNADFRRGQAPGGSLHLHGSFQFDPHNSQFTLSAHNLNQHALSPFLDPLFAPHSLRTIALNGSSSFQLQPHDLGRLRAQLQITNLTTRTPTQHATPTPLRSDLQLDTSWQTNLYSIHQAQLSLPPTSRAHNQLLLAGTLNLSPTDPTPTELQLTADTLDLTPIDDLFFPPTTARPDPDPASDPVEPKPLDLGLRDFTLLTRINQLFLREIHLSQLVANTSIHNGDVRLNPLTATINGAPFSGQLELNLNLPRWRYDLQLHTRNLPLQPWIDSFAPQYRGQYRGQLHASIQLQGQGFTTPALQQHLQGRADLTLTNAQIQIVSPNFQRILRPIASLLRLPQLNESPLDWVQLQSRIGAGQIHLDALAIQSPAFQARTTGSIPIESHLNRAYLNLPLQFELRRSLAERARLLPANTPADAAYVALPNFATVRGTLANPSTELNPSALASLLIRSGVDIAEQQGLKLDEPATRLLRGLGDILGGLPLPGSQPPPKPKPDTHLPPPAPLPIP